MSAFESQTPTTFGIYFFTMVCLLASVCGCVIVPPPLCLHQKHNRWWKLPWLFSECYMYRRIREANLMS